MNKDSLVVNFLGGESLQDFLPMFLWAIIGLVLSMLLELVASSKIKRTGGFIFSFWLKDNFVRMITSIFIIFIGSVFGSKIVGELSNWGTFTIGFLTDKSIEALIKLRKKVDLTNITNIFITKK